MIPAIGIMVGFYIITRMLDDILVGKKEGKSSYGESREVVSY